MLTVGKDVSQVERQLLTGLLVCPDCGGRLEALGTRAVTGAARGG